MIEKIKVLQGESANTPNPELAAALGLVLPGIQSDSDLLSDNKDDEGDGGGDGRNSANTTDRTQHHQQQQGITDTGTSTTTTDITQTLIEDVASTELPGNGKRSIGIREDRKTSYSEIVPVMSPLSTMRNSMVQFTPTSPSNIQQQLDLGGESDTNSHSALITDTPVHKPKPKHQNNLNKSSNKNSSSSSSSTSTTIVMDNNINPTTTTTKYNGNNNKLEAAYTATASTQPPLLSTNDNLLPPLHGLYHHVRQTQI